MHYALICLIIDTPHKAYSSFAASRRNHGLSKFLHAIPFLLVFGTIWTRLGEQFSEQGRVLTNYLGQIATVRWKQSLLDAQAFWKPSGSLLEAVIARRLLQKHAATTWACTDCQLT